jgi:hypothetical protein
MRLLLSSALLGLAWFAAVNVVFSAAVWPLAHAMARRGRPSGANTLLVVRLLPALASFVFVLGVFLPAHWRFEPPMTEETFGIVIGGGAALGLALMARSVRRAVSVCRTDLRLAALTRASARRIPTGAFEVRGVPGVSLAGVIRPRILIGPEVLAALTPAELDVAIDHEVAHRRSRDNFKRFLMFSAPDVLGWFPIARWLEEEWQATSECEADASAVRGDDSRAVVLASALVKVARLISSREVALRSPAWSAFHVPTLLEVRVRRLVTGSVTTPASGGSLGAASALAALVVPVSAWLLGFSYPLHLVTEALVTYLP